MKQMYVAKNFRNDALLLIDQVNDILEDYAAQGYRMTLRQVYYQLVAGDIIENSLNSYKRVAGIVNDAKLSGLVDWESMEDRTREFIRRSHWRSGKSILETCAKTFFMDMWDNQSTRVFVIIEKEALVGVLEDTCRKFDVPILAARGYPSGTVLREFAHEDLLPALEHGQSIQILHLGDHDPSGLDMTRDLRERIGLFCEGSTNWDSVHLSRIALNMEQIHEFNPPPNPAKATDARFSSYRKKYGKESWELDALKPQYLNDMVEEHIRMYMDWENWEIMQEQIEDVKSRLLKAANDFEGDDA